MGFPCCIYGDGVDKQRKGLVKPSGFISAKGKSRHRASGDGTGHGRDRLAEAITVSCGVQIPARIYENKNKIVVL